MITTYDDETTTERRQLTHARLHGVLTGRGDCESRDTELGDSLRALGLGQRQILDALCEVFEEHPDLQNLPDLFEHLGAHLLCFAPEGVD